MYESFRPFIGTVNELWRREFREIYRVKIEFSTTAALHP